jgi:hypothetical protein
MAGYFRIHCNTKHVVPVRVFYVDLPIGPETSVQYIFSQFDFLQRLHKSANEISEKRINALIKKRRTILCEDHFLAKTAQIREC